VVIQINPHTEPAPIQEQRPQTEGAAESQKPQSEKNKIGVFAKILAGLTGRSAKTGTAGQTTGLENPNKVPLAETAGKKGKGIRVETADLAEKNKTKKSLETGVKKPERVQSELSGQELFAIGRLTGQGKEQNVSEKTKGDAGFEGLKADRRNLGREAVKPETVSAHHGEDTAKAERQSLMATAAGDLAENAKSAAEKAKNRFNAAEAGIKNKSAVGEINGDQQAEAKKVLASQKPGVEKEGRNRLEEARNKRRSTTFEVRDFRTQTANAPQHGIPVPAGFEARLPAEGTGKDIILELRLPQGQDASSATTSWEAKATQSFENILARELHQNLNNDIVRHASVALRDGNEGTIRLALKPESLGNVKIHLELAENKIIGHIVVESEEALRAFQKEISSLEKAFRDSGFEAANLEMSLAGDGRGAENQWQEAEASQFLNEQFAASRYDAAIEQTELPLTLDIYSQGATAINVLA
jgi:flagellar hook-length control protein FliK